MYSELVIWLYLYHSSDSCTSQPFHKTIKT